MKKPIWTKQIAKLISAFLRKLKWGSLLPDKPRGIDFNASKVDRYFEEKEVK